MIDAIVLFAVLIACGLAVRSIVRGDALDCSSCSGKCGGCSRSCTAKRGLHLSARQMREIKALSSKRTR